MAWICCGSCTVKVVLNGTVALRGMIAGELEGSSVLRGTVPKPALLKQLDGAEDDGESLFDDLSLEDRAVGVVPGSG